MRTEVQKACNKQMGIPLPPTPPNMITYSSDRNVIFDFFEIVFKKFISRLWGNFLKLHLYFEVVMYITKNKPMSFFLNMYFCLIEYFYNKPPPQPPQYKIK